MRAEECSNQTANCFCRDQIRVAKIDTIACKNLLVFKENMQLYDVFHFTRTVSCFANDRLLLVFFPKKCNKIYDNKFRSFLTRSVVKLEIVCTTTVVLLFLVKLRHTLTRSVVKNCVRTILSVPGEIASHRNFPISGKCCVKLFC